jgi:hypothetical protein
VRLLLQPELFRHVLERLEKPDWEAQVLARAQVFACAQGSESGR